MRRAVSVLAVLALAGAAVFWWVTRPVVAGASVLDGITPDLAQGELVFHAGGCASCHSADKADGEAKLVLSGGRAFASPFGTFYAPNISSDPEHGIGGWSALDLYNAMKHGVSPGGRHYFPAFPYTSYVRATAEDIMSLHAYMQTLPADATANRAHDVGFPFNIRRSLGGWKVLFGSEGWVVEADLTEEEARGRYLAEALGHCGECHTPRNVLGGPDYGRWLAGAPNPTGSGRIPNITPAKFDWSKADIVEYFTSGFTPEFDTVGGHMVDVVENLSKLPREDRAAIAAYLKKVPGVE
ncbi:MAG: cytochrome c [Rhodobacter sp.]|nr:cytochrome c [Rhodobacter sp.]